MALTYNEGGCSSYVPKQPRNDDPTARKVRENQNEGGTDSFARQGVQALLGSGVSPFDLRVGGRFTGDLARALQAALTEAAGTISRMPAHHMTFPNGGPVLPSTPHTPPRLRTGVLELDAATLWGWGELLVPRHLWQALGRFTCWIEPALITEWLRLIRGYAINQDRQLDPSVLATATSWSEPSRDVALPRSLALRLLESGNPLHCVWTGKRLQAGSLDIDHCLPWSAWPCGDLWNLVPADRAVNQQAKRDRLPAEGLLQIARGPILGWWQAAYLQGEALPRRFVEEARASLPGLAGEAGLPPCLRRCSRLWACSVCGCAMTSKCQSGPGERAWMRQPVPNQTCQATLLSVL